jgi:hypothetical protein
LRADVSLGPDNRSRGYGTVLLATAEDAGRAVDMFNGYTWQTRVLEVRLDRLMPEYEQGRVGMGTGIGTAMATGPYLGLTTGGSLSGAASSAQSGLGSGHTGIACTVETGPSTNLPLLAHPNAVASPILRTSTFSQNFVPSRPSSSSAAVQDLDFLHSSGSAGAIEFQSTDPTANRTLFVGNVCESICPISKLFHFFFFGNAAPLSYPMARLEGSIQTSGHYPPCGCCAWTRQSFSRLRHRCFCNGSRCRESC